MQQRFQGRNTASGECAAGDIAGCSGRAGFGREYVDKKGIKCLIFLNAAISTGSIVEMER
jgi:hypothetical protein